MMLYNYRDILEMSDEERFTHQNSIINLEFPDGSTECRFREAALSAYVWEMVDEEIDEVQISQNYLIRLPFTHKSISKMYERIVADIVSVAEDPMKVYERHRKTIAVSMNRIYNAVVTWIPHYTTAANAQQLREIIHHPELEQVYHELKPSHHSLNKAYAATSRLLNDSPDLADNPFARGYRIGTLDARQFNQVVMARGFVSDIDYHQFRKPVLTGYGRGLHKPLDTAMESRDASISELQSKEPVQKSDYLNRRLQIMARIVSNIHYGDCGSNEYIPWYVEERDLESLAGVHYLLEDGTLGTIREKDKHLIGTKIQMRSPVTCHHLHKYQVCSTCLGTIANQIPFKYSIGQIAVIGALGAFVQLSLSAKHLIVSRETTTFVLETEAAKFIKFPKQDDVNSLVLNPSIVSKGQTVEFIFRNKDLVFLADVQNGINAEDIQISAASFVKTFSAEVKLKNGDRIIKPINVANHASRSHLSKEFINYVIEHPEMVTPGRGVVRINLEHWNKKDVIFNIPQRVSSVKDFMSSFESTIKTGSVKYGIDANSPAGLSDMIRLLYDIVRECVYISIPHLSLMVASLLIRDKSKLDYRLPLPGGPREFDTMANLYAYRSLSQMMAYEKRLMYLRSPSLTLVAFRPNHVFDALYFPQASKPYADVNYSIEKGLYDNAVFYPIGDKLK